MKELFLTITLVLSALLAHANASNEIVIPWQSIYMDGSGSVDVQVLRGSYPYGDHGEQRLYYLHYRNSTKHVVKGEILMDLHADGKISSTRSPFEVKPGVKDFAVPGDFYVAESLLVKKFIPDGASVSSASSQQKVSGLPDLLVFPGPSKNTSPKPSPRN
jgi:hypothetical protein